MQTKLDKSFLTTRAGQEADRILRACVHCGFCTATCPTYQLLGDELDGPRGRIYQIKLMLEGKQTSDDTRTHLDRCLTCRSCETTCPSGVEYAHLLEIGREIIEQKTSRPLWQKLWRRYLLWLLPETQRFRRVLSLAQLFRPVLFGSLKKMIPARTTEQHWPGTTHARRVLLIDGCVQPILSPDINAATARVLDKLGIESLRIPGCCVAIEQHMSEHERAKIKMRAMIDQLWPHIEQGAEAIIMTASGCGAHMKEYAYLLRDDANYADKARQVSSLTKDISEILAQENLAPLQLTLSTQRIAFHPPCTLQHAQKLGGKVEKILSGLGFNLVNIEDAHLCCGSAGTYSMQQPVLSKRLRTQRLHGLQVNQPELIATANIGCLHHLAAGTDVPVIHWINLLDAQ